MFALAAAFAESLRATLQPCTFLLIAPVAAVVVAARCSWQALVAVCVAAVVGGWVLVDNSWILEGLSLRLAALLVVTLLAITAIPQLANRVRVAALVATPWWQTAITAIITLIATMWWRPCVGAELGAILNGADDGIAGQLVPMAAYMLGAMVPVAILVAARYAINPNQLVLQRASAMAAVLGSIVALALVVGQHGRVVETLTRWTLN